MNGVDYSSTRAKKPLYGKEAVPFTDKLIVHKNDHLYWVYHEKVICSPNKSVIEEWAANNNLTLIWS